MSLKEEKRTPIGGEEAISVDRRGFGQWRHGDMWALQEEGIMPATLKGEEEELIVYEYESGFGCEKIGEDSSQVWSPEEKNTFAADLGWLVEVDCKWV